MAGEARELLIAVRHQACRRFMGKPVAMAAEAGVVQKIVAALGGPGALAAAAAAAADLLVPV